MNKSLRVAILFSLMTIVFSHDVLAQVKKSRKVMKADRAFELEEYFKAAELYKKAYQKTKSRALKAEIIFKQAECYRLAGNTNRAESYYKRAIKAKYPDVRVFLLYADMLRQNEDYDEAKVQYKKYMELNPTDVNGEKGLRSCDFAQEWLTKPTRYQVELMSLVNSRYSDFSPAFGNGQYSELYFTSSRKGGVSDKIDDRTGESFTDVYVTKLDKKGKWSAPRLEAEPINTIANEGSVYLNKRGTSMYLTQCRVEKKKDLGCGIYISKRKGKVWSEPILLQIKVDSNTTAGHPALNQDESLLVFASDLSGGYGGKDLWLVKKNKRSGWSDPINLGPAINTAGDEMFPFIHADGSIYFASNGHIGMGGFDIFKSTPDENGAFSSVLNLKYPVNSAGDDFGMIIEENGERGYFSSNRNGGKGSDDIYEFILPPLKLSVQGVITDSKTGAIMTNVKVQLIGSDESIEQTSTDNTGTYKFNLKPLTSYEMVINNEGYLNKTVRETTIGVEKNKVFEVNISLDPVKKEVVLPRIEYDFAKWDLRPQSIIDLNILTETLKENPNVVIELKSHTDYVGSARQNMKLSQKRADVCVDYLISQGIEAERLIGKGMGESEPFVIEEKSGRFDVGDVLTENYIKKIRFRKNKDKANQYNRRTSFKVLREDYVPKSSSDEKDK